MKTRMRTITAAVAGLSLAAPFAAQGMQHPTGTQRTISGSVVDISCHFGQGLSGSSHRECAQVCADKGIPLAILGSDDKLYLPISTAMPGDGQNARLREYAEQQVTARGAVFPAAGGNAIQIASIQRKS